VDQKKWVLFVNAENDKAEKEHRKLILYDGSGKYKVVLERNPIMTNIEIESKNKEGTNYAVDE